MLVRAWIASGDEFAPGDGLVVGRVARVDERVSQVVELALDLLHVHFVVGERGTRDRIPVDQSFAAVDQPLAEETEERLTHGPRTNFVHREPLAVPVAGTAQRTELVGDGFFVLVFPRLHAGDELVTLVVGSAFAFLLEQPILDDGLRGDTGVVGAGHPEGFVAFHAVDAGEDVLECVVEGVPDVQRGRHVGRGDKNAVGLALAGKNAGRIGVERVGVGPALADAWLGE